MDAQAFIDVIRARNRREAIAGGLASLGFGSFAVLLPGWEVKAGCVAAALASAFVSGFVLRVGGVRRDLPLRDEMLRQARLLDLVPIWYLGPPAITLLGLTVAMHRGFTAAGQDSGGAWMVYGVFLLLLCPFVVLVNRAAARRLRRDAASVGTGPG